MPSRTHPPSTPARTPATPRRAARALRTPAHVLPIRQRPINPQQILSHTNTQLVIHAHQATKAFLENILFRHVRRGLRPQILHGVRTTQRDRHEKIQRVHRLNRQRHTVQPEHQRALNARHGRIRRTNPTHRRQIRHRDHPRRQRTHRTRSRSQRHSPEQHEPHQTQTNHEITSNRRYAPRR